MFKLIKIVYVHQKIKSTPDNNKEKVWKIPFTEWKNNCLNKLTKIKLLSNKLSHYPISIKPLILNLKIQKKSSNKKINQPIITHSIINNKRKSSSNYKHKNKSSQIN